MNGNDEGVTTVGTWAPSGASVYHVPVEDPELLAAVAATASARDCTSLARRGGEAPEFPAILLREEAQSRLPEVVLTLQSTYRTKGKFMSASNKSSTPMHVSEAISSAQSAAVGDSKTFTWPDEFESIYKLDNGAWTAWFRKFRVTLVRRGNTFVIIEYEQALSKNFPGFWLQISSLNYAGVVLGTCKYPPPGQGVELVCTPGWAHIAVRNEISFNGDFYDVSEKLRIELPGVYIPVECSNMPGPG